MKRIDQHDHLDLIIDKTFREVMKITRYDFPKESTEPFMKFHKWLVSTPESPGITKLRSEQNVKNDKYHKFTNLVLGSMQETVGCVHYHRENLSLIETAFDKIQNTTSFKLLNNYEYKNMAGGNSRKLDYEYQAFILAVRRCLEYFTLAIATYFKQDFHSFTRLPECLDGRKPKEIAEALKVPIYRHHKILSHFYSKDGKRSPRDEISHFGHVSAGVVNVTSKGIFLAGGGENLHYLFDSNSGLIKLGDVLDKHLNALENFISETIDALITADQKYYK